jgi:hypothetical protein
MRAGPTSTARARRCAPLAGSAGAAGLAAPKQGHHRRRPAGTGGWSGGSRLPGRRRLTTPPAARLAHRRAAADGAQRAFIVFGGGGGAELPWLRPLRHGFRHCFAALQDPTGWTVLDALSGRLVVARLDLPRGFDLPGFYRRADLLVLGPFLPGGPRRSLLPSFAPFSCVSLCRAVLGADAPFALTPFGLFRALARQEISRNKVVVAHAE